MFILVRHAHAAEKKRWKGRDSDRPLTARGRQQAAGLTRNLSAIPGARFLSSPALRCYQMLGPLAERFDRLIETSALLSPGADAAGLEVFLDGPDLEGAVLCTHGETLSGLIERWRRRHDVTFPVDMFPAAGGSSRGRNQTEKGGAWIVVDEQDGRSLHYLRPVHLGPVLAVGESPPAAARSWARGPASAAAARLRLRSAPEGS